MDTTDLNTDHQGLIAHLPYTALGQLPLPKPKSPQDHPQAPTLITPMKREHKQALTEAITDQLHPQTYRPMDPPKSDHGRPGQPPLDQAGPWPNHSDSPQVGPPGPPSNDGQHSRRHHNRTFPPGSPNSPPDMPHQDPPPPQSTLPI
jgi:hypothetical protein